MLKISWTGTFHGQVRSALSLFYDKDKYTVSITYLYFKKLDSVALSKICRKGGTICLDVIYIYIIYIYYIYILLQLQQTIKL